MIFKKILDKLWRKFWISSEKIMEKHQSNEIIDSTEVIKKFWKHFVEILVNCDETLKKYGEHFISTDFETFSWKFCKNFQDNFWKNL